MLEKKGTKSFGVGLGLLIGAAVGFVAGVLYAPRSGKETRTIIRGKARDAENKAEELIVEAKGRAKKIIEDAKGKSSEPEGEEL